MLFFKHWQKKFLLQAVKFSEVVSHAELSSERWFVASVAAELEIIQQI